MCGLFLFGQDMQRAIVYSGSIPLETDILKTNQYSMVGLAKLSAAVFGASGVVVNGLACTPTTPAGLTVNVAPGEMYSVQNLEATAYSSLPADTAHQILKQGVSLDTVNLSCPAPATAGQSINYLIQGAFQEADQSLVALPYYNASNPTQAWSGPNNTGTAQATVRSGNIVLSAKAGTAAATGSQTTPAADSGYTGLWVVTVANGQTQITAGNIVQATNAPILPADLLHAVQASSLITGTDTGAANACVVNYSYPVTALTDGMVLWFKAKAANTGATTLNVNGLGAQPVVGASHSALQGGEIVANGKAQVVWNATISSFVLIECTGAALQVAPATQSQHAIQLGQAVGRLLNVQVFTASGTYTPTAGMTKAIVEVQGAGGGSGGAPATSAGQFSGSSGASSGTYAKCLLTAAQIGASQAVTVGAAGTAGATGFSTGGTGGTSSLGSLIVCTGGPGSQSYGPSGATIVISNAPTVSATVPTTTGTVIQVSQGSVGNAAIGATSGGVLSGPGGSSPMTGANTGVGAGAPGSVLIASSSAVAGAAGGAGKIVIWEYA